MAQLLTCLDELGKGNNQVHQIIFKSHKSVREAAKKVLLLMAGPLIGGGGEGKGPGH